ncbi:MAG: nucleotidyltransferase domain-containing protein, partial [bacterium]
MTWQGDKTLSPEIEDKMREKAVPLNKPNLVESMRSFLSKREEIIFAYIFGSFVEESEPGDVDIALYLDENNQVARDLWYEIRFSIELEKEFRLPFDVIRLSRAPDHLIYEISKGIVVKNSDDDLRVDFI